MKIIQEKWVGRLLIQGYGALALYPFLLVRPGKVITDRLIRHESIHHRQQVELLIIGFLLWYLLEYLIRLLIKLVENLYWHRRLKFRLAARYAYYDVSFEREAYAYEYDEKYLQNRKRYAWTRFF